MGKLVYIHKGKYSFSKERFNIFNDKRELVFIGEMDKHGWGINIHLKKAIIESEILTLKQDNILKFWRYSLVSRYGEKLIEGKKNFMTSKIIGSGEVGKIIIRKKDLLGRKYTIEINNNVVCNLMKKRRKEERYTLDIVNEEYREIIIMTSMMIDLIKVRNIVREIFYVIL